MALASLKRTKINISRNYRTKGDFVLHSCSKHHGDTLVLCCM